MSTLRSQSIYPQLCQYLQAKVKASSRGIPIGLVVASVATVPGIPILATIIGFASGVHSAFLGIAIFLSAFFFLCLGSLAVLLPRWIKAVRRHREGDLDDVSRHLHHLAQTGQLHHRLDPRAGDILEAGAAAWQRIAVVVQSERIPEGENPFASDAQMAADDAMLELTQLCGCRVGQPRQTKREELNAIHQSFRDLEIVAGLTALQRWTKSGWRDSAFRDPHTQFILESGYEIVQKLETTAKELEEYAQESTWNRLRTSSTATEKMDDLLENLRAHRRAEEELHDDNLRH